MPRSATEMPAVLGHDGRLDADEAAILRVLDGVVDEVHEALGDGLGIGLDERHRLGYGHLHLEALLLELRLEGLHRLRHDAPQIRVAEVEVLAPGVDLREVQDVVDHVRQPPALAPDDLQELELLLLAGDAPQLHRLAGEANEGERGLQLVRDVGEERGLGLGELNLLGGLADGEPESRQNHHDECHESDVLESHEPPQRQERAPRRRPHRDAPARQHVAHRQLRPGVPAGRVGGAVEDAALAVQHAECQTRGHDVGPVHLALAEDLILHQVLEEVLVQDVRVQHPAGNADDAPAETDERRHDERRLVGRAWHHENRVVDGGDGGVPHLERGGHGAHLGAVLAAQSVGGGPRPIRVRFGAHVIRGVRLRGAHQIVVGEQERLVEERVRRGENLQVAGRRAAPRRRHAGVLGHALDARAHARRQRFRQEPCGVVAVVFAGLGEIVLDVSRLVSAEPGEKENRQADAQEGDEEEATLGLLAGQEHGAAVPRSTLDRVARRHA